MAKKHHRNKSYSKKARRNVAKNYAMPKLPLFAELAGLFKPVDLAAIPELAPFVEIVEGEEIIRNYQYRAYPVDEVATKINQTIGCCRVLHNKFVEHLYDHLESIGFEGGYIDGYKVPLYTEIKAAIGKDYMDAPDATAYANEREAFEKSIEKYNKEFAPRGKQCRKKAIRRAKNGGAPLTFRDLKGLPKFHAKFQVTDAYKSNAVGGNIKLTPKPDHSEKVSELYAGDNSLLRGNAKDYKAYALLKLPKMEAFEVVLHRPLPAGAKIKTVVVAREKWGEYAVTLTVSFRQNLTRLKNTDEAKAAAKAYLEEHLDLALGLDYAQKEGCVGSGDEEAKKNLDLLIAAAFGKQFRHMEARLGFLQRLRSRKRGPNHKEGVEASLSYKKISAKIAKLDGKIRRRRKDALEKLARVLSDAFLLVAVEDIDLRGMSQGLKLAKNLLDNGFGMFREMLKRKLSEQGKLYVVIDKWFPSSQTCKHCGYKNPEVKDKKVRDWTCPVCGAHHDRDHNAAENIRDEGIRTLENAALFAEKRKGSATRAKYTKKTA